MEQMVFIKKDCKVEVFWEKGSWYRAILEDDPTESGNKKLKVGYLTLLNEDRSAPLTEFVDQSFIRPVPPEDLNAGVVFEEGLMVVAYLEGGWWTGVLVKIMEDEKCWVYFDCPPDIIQFETKQLRVHLDWTGFKWVRPNNKEMVKSVFSSGSTVEFRRNFAWLPAIIIELENDKRVIDKHWNKSFSCSENWAQDLPCIRRVRTPLAEFVEQSFIRPVPSEDLNEGVVFEEGSMVDAYLKDGWWTGVVVKTMEDGEYLVYFDCLEDIIQFEKKQLRSHLDWTGFKWIRPDKKELVKSDFSSGTMVELRLESAWLPAIIIKELKNDERVIVKHWNKYFSCREESKIIIVDLQRVRPPQPPFSVGEYELLDHVEAFRDFQWCQGVVRGIVFEGRYMVSFGRTRVASQFSHSDLRPPMEWKDGVWQKNKIQGKISPEPMRNQNGLGNESTPKNMPEKHKNKYYTRKRKRGKPEHNSDNNETVLSSDRTPNVVKKSAAHAEETQAKDTKMVLPFAKKSPIWKTYESMEVFKRVPQNPHFSPLFEDKEDFREGSALGMMAIYSGLMEKFKNLETEVPVSQLDSLKDSFAMLEKHGFNIVWPLSRIDKLLALKDRQLHILEGLNGFDKERMVESIKKRKAKEEFDEIEQTILEVKHRILELQRQEEALEEHKEAAEKKMDAAYQKICQVESCARYLSVELEHVEFDFETILSSPW